MIESERGRVADPYMAPYFPNVKTGILDRLVRLVSAVDQGVDLGFHLCYEDMGHVHFAQPEDTAVLTDFANSIKQKVSPIHPIKYFHMLVPKDRVDETYFFPLNNLQLGDTKLFLGLVHPNDEMGTRKRIETAKAVLPAPFGVASECGLGRTSREELDSILAIYKAVT